MQQAFVVTFGRAGEDNKKFKLGDADLTLQGFAGADYDLQVPGYYLGHEVWSSCSPRAYALLAMSSSRMAHMADKPACCKAHQRSVLLQNALTTATEKKNYVREVDGQAFYTYEVVGTVSPILLQHLAWCPLGWSALSCQY